MKSSVVRSSPAFRTTLLSRALLVALASVSLPALAARECGAPDANGQVVCTATGEPVPQVRYEGVTDFELVLQQGFGVDGNLQKDPETAVVVYGDGAVKLTAEDGTIIRAHDGWPAVDVVSSTGSVTVRADQVYGGNVGIAALAAGDVDVWANQVGGVVAVEAISTGGNVTVDVAGVTGGAFGAGVAAITDMGNVTILAGETIATGDYTTGLFASTHSGSTSIEAGYILAEGTGATAVFAESWDNGDVIVDVATATAMGEGSVGILAGAGMGNVAVRSDWVSSNSLGVGVFAFNGNATVDIDGISTEGDFARGLDISAFGTVDVLNDSVTTFGYGSDAINIETVGDVALQSRRLATYGGEAYGLRVLTSGNVDLDIDEVSTYGELASALFVGTDAGDIDARVGRVHTYATTGDWFAIGLGSNSGDVNLLVEEEAIADSGYAITTGAWMGGVHIGVAEGATVFGQAVGIDSTSSTGTRIDIAGTVGSGSGPAIQVAGNDNGLGKADIRIGATGTLLGRLQLSGGADVVANAGDFLGAGTSVFGAGNDRFDNAGLVGLQDGATGIAFAGLETFNNSGLVSLANGATGDVFAVSGTLNGTAAGTLAVDVDISGHTADRIEVGALSGTNVLELDLIGSGSLLGMDNITVLTSEGTQTGNELVLAANSRNRGFVGFRLDYDGFDSWTLESDLTDAAYLAGAVPAGVRDLWRQGAQAVSTHLTATHDEAEAGGVWFQAVGGEFEGTSGFSHAQGAQELEWEGDHQGVQLGAGTTFGHWHAGITGGAGKATMDLGGGERTELDSLNLGLYARWSNAGWFTEGLVRADRFDVESDWGSIGLQARGDGSAVGVALEGGRRFTPASLWIEPYVRMAWVDVSLPDLDGVTGDVHWEDGANATGELGLRLGLADGWGPLRPYAAMSVAREIGDGDATVYDIGVDQVRVTEDGDRTFGRFAGGAEWTLGRVDLYGEVEARVGDMEGTSGRIGARVRF